MSGNSVVLYRCSCSLLSYQRSSAPAISSAFTTIWRRRRTTIAIGTGGGYILRAIRLSKNYRSCVNNSSNGFVIANDEKYGNKQNISLTPRLYDYILSNVREPEILRQLREETASMRGSQMQVSPDQAQLLAMLVQILGAKRCIEVGVYTVTTTLSFTGILPFLFPLLLHALPDLVACERDAKSLQVAKKYYELAGVSHKVNVKHGMAADILNDSEWGILQVRVGGVIVIDNVLWHGKVADPLVNDAKTVSIRSFNNNIIEDQRVSISMVPVGDGITICRKR